jgi:hypothetical protein
MSTFFQLLKIKNKNKKLYNFFEIFNILTELLIEFPKKWKFVNYTLFFARNVHLFRNLIRQKKTRKMNIFAAKNGGVCQK